MTELNVTTEAEILCEQVYKITMEPYSKSQNAERKTQNAEHSPQSAVLILYKWLEPKVVWFFKFLITIGSIFALLYLFMWWGIRGLSGLIAGMFIIAYLLLSMNPLVMFFVKLFHGHIDVSIWRDSNKSNTKENIPPYDIEKEN